MNNHLRQDIKARVYRETEQKDNRNIQNERMKMRIGGRISGKSLLNTERSKDIRILCNVEDANGWLKTLK